MWGRPEDQESRPGLCARVLRFGAGAPGGPEIGEFRLDAFDVEADRGVAGKGEGHIAARVIARFETDGKQRQHPVGGRGLQRLDLRAEHAVEAQRRAPPLIGVVGSGLRRLFPVEAVENGGEAPLRGDIGQVPDPHHRILQVRRHDLEILFIERNQLKLVVGHRGIPARTVPPPARRKCGLFVIRRR